MKKRNFISNLTPGIVLAAVLGGALAVPTAASAHEVVTEKRVKVIRTTEHQDHHRRGDVDRWYLERHREASRGWAPANYRHKHHHKGDRGRGHKYGHRKHRDEYREVRVYRPAERHRDYDRYERHDRHEHRDRNGVRISIGYDFVL